MPSNPKGFVTTPIVNAPDSFAISAITGAAPVPVPPPIPAATKTRSESSTNSLTRLLLSSAHSLPLDGSPPTPNPLAVFSPIFIAVAISLVSSACESVLKIIYSTWSILFLYILFTAFDPPPPTPRTFMFALDLFKLLFMSFNSVIFPPIYPIFSSFFNFVFIKLLFLSIFLLKIFLFSLAKLKSLRSLSSFV